MQQERRAGKFTERISLFMARVSAAGAALVLLAPTLSFTFSGQTIVIGGAFSDDLKGAVIGLILVAGWTAIKEYWLGSSAGSDKKSETLNKIASDSTLPPTEDKP